MFPNSTVCSHESITEKGTKYKISERCNAKRLEVGGIDGLDVRWWERKDLSVTIWRSLKCVAVSGEQLLKIFVAAADFLALEDLGIYEIEAEEAIFLRE